MLRPHLGCMNYRCVGSLAIELPMPLRVRSSTLVVSTINRDEERTQVGTSMADFDHSLRICQSYESRPMAVGVTLNEY